MVRFTFIYKKISTLQTNSLFCTLALFFVYMKDNEYPDEAVNSRHSDHEMIAHRTELNSLVSKTKLSS